MDEMKYIYYLLWLYFCWNLTQNFNALIIYFTSTLPLVKYFETQSFWSIYIHVSFSSTCDLDEKEVYQERQQFSCNIRLLY
jgi:hypothetical protein